MREVHIIGVPLDLGSGRRGVDMGPSALRIAGLGERVGALGYRVVDQGNIETPVVETKAHGDTNKRYIEEISRVCEGLYRTALASPARCQSCWVAIIAWELGRSAQPPAGPPSNQSRIGLLWIDAHADMNTPVTTLTGNVHGMPLAAILGSEPSELAAIGPPSPKVDPRHSVLLALRDVDAQEKESAREAGVHVFTMKDIDRDGLAHVASRALAETGRGTAGLHVSFDLDACDPSIAPRGRHPGQRRTELSRGAHDHGACCRNRSLAVSRYRRGKSHPGYTQRHRPAGGRARALGPRQNDHLRLAIFLLTFRSARRPIRMTLNTTREPLCLVALLATATFVACGGGQTEDPAPEDMGSMTDAPSAEPTEATFPLGGGTATEVHAGQAGSPHVKVDWQVNGATVSITYGRPSLNGRTVGDDVEPMADTWWRLGADEATTLTSSSDLMVGGAHVPAGEYTLFTQQMDGEFHLIVNSETGQWGTAYNADSDVVHVAMNVTELDPPADQLTLSIVDGQLGFEWGQMTASTSIMAH